MKIENFNQKLFDIHYFSDNLGYFCIDGEEETLYQPSDKEYKDALEEEGGEWPSLDKIENFYNNFERKTPEIIFLEKGSIQKYSTNITHIFNTDKIEISNLRSLNVNNENKMAICE